MKPLKTIAFHYEAREDRILAGINLGRPEAWSCWLTRRLVLALFDRAPKFVASTSQMVQRTSAEFRDELATFERDAALAKTAKALVPTPDKDLKAGFITAVLVESLTVFDRDGHFDIEIVGQDREGVAGALARAEFERILEMLKAEATKAGWTTPPASSDVKSGPETSPTTSRVN